MVIELEIINMLSKSKELQNRREFTVGNMYYNMNTGQIEIIGLRKGNNKIFTSLNYPLRDDKTTYIWIPSQRQLQNIYYKECHDTLFKRLDYEFNKLEITALSLDAIGEFIKLMAKFNIFFVNYYEIWIAFIMYDLYSKAWAYDSWRLFKYTEPPKKTKKGKKKK